MRLPEANVRQFFDILRERYLIQQRREAGEPPPWTKDPIFAAWRFCCVLREDDKTTRWFREKLRDPLRNNPVRVLMAAVAFRWFNRIETGEMIRGMLLNDGWNSKEARLVLSRQHPLVTGAYIIKTPDGMNKLDGVCQCIDGVLKDADKLARELLRHRPEKRTLKSVWSALREYPYMGDFMAYQVICDLRHTCWLDRAADANHWAALGPGSTRGMGWLACNDPDYFSRNSAADVEAMLELMRELLRLAESGRYFPLEFGIPWDMQCVQHNLCEAAKYRAAMNGERLKRRFQA